MTTETARPPEADRPVRNRGFADDVAELIDRLPGRITPADWVRATATTARTVLRDGQPLRRLRRLG